MIERGWKPLLAALALAAPAGAINGRVYDKAADPTFNSAATGWRAGDRPLARWSGDGFWYPASIRKVKDGKFLVAFEDGDEEWTIAGRLLQDDIESGDRVYAKLGERGPYRLATVAGRGGGGLQLRFDDGSERAAALADIRVLRPKENMPAAPAATPAAFRVGERILARWTEDNYWYAGAVESAEGGRYFVRFDDGDVAWTDASRMGPEDIQAGDKVFAKWKGGKRYFPGTVTSRGGETVSIRYDDGDEETTTLAALRVRRPR